MPRQRFGLRNRSFDELVVVREEIGVARFHTVLDRWLTDEDVLR